MFMRSKADGGFGHTNVLKMIDVSMMDGSLCIAMPKLSMSLGAAIDSKTLDRPKMVNISHGVLSALSFLHANGMIHRDVKSDNIMIDEECKAQLIDFSLAKIMPLENDGIADGSRTHTPEVGTATYIAPEVYAKMPYGFKSDAYSAGVCLLEMFSGAKLQTDRDKAALVLVRKKKDELPPADKPLPALLRSLLEEDPATRLSCRQVLGDVSLEGQSEIVSTITKLWAKNKLPTTPPPLGEQRVLESALKSLQQTAAAPEATKASGSKKRKAGGKPGSPSIESRVKKACTALDVQCDSTEAAAIAYAKSTESLGTDGDEAVPAEYCVVLAMKMYEEALPNLEDAAIDLADQYVTHVPNEMNVIFLPVLSHLHPNTSKVQFRVGRRRVP